MADALSRSIPKIWLDRKWRLSDVREVADQERTLFDKRMYWRLSAPVDRMEKRFLLVTTIPWATVDIEPQMLKLLWQPVGCTICPDVLPSTYALPFGNLRPTYFVVGEAPGRRPPGDPQRAWSFGPGSKTLRKAAALAGIYWDCWFTNLLKCALPDNRKPSLEEEVNCSRYLFAEMKLLRPRVVVLLGKHVQQSFPPVSGVDVIRVQHPSFYARKGGLARALAKEIIMAMRGEAGEVQPADAPTA